MFHTAVVSEPVAWLTGVVVGCAGVLGASAAGLDPQASLGVGSAAAVLSSLVIGTPINVALLDVLTLVALRPATGIGLWYAMPSIARGLAG
jgi:hypothetical protein